MIIFGAKYYQEHAIAHGGDETLLIESQVLTFFAALCVCFANILIELTLRRFRAYEKHHTEENANRSMFLRLFVLQLINTSIIFLFDNSASIMHAFNITITGGHLEFSANWFNTVGVTVILVQICNVFSTHLFKWSQYLTFVRARRHYAKHPEQLLTQDELNKAYVGEWRLSIACTDDCASRCGCLLQARSWTSRRTTGTC